MLFTIRFDSKGRARLFLLFMECGVCDKPSGGRAKVFIKNDELYLCVKCVMRLQRQNLEYCAADGRYRFNGNLRENRLLRGRRQGVHRLPKGKAATS